MSVAFWSAKLSKGDKPVEVQPPEGYVLNVQNLALTDAGTNTALQVKVQTVSIEGDRLESVIATMRSPTAEQVAVNLVFGFDVPVSFSVAGTGSGSVYISGKCTKQLCEGCLRLSYAAPSMHIALRDAL